MTAVIILALLAGALALCLFGLWLADQTSEEEPPILHCHGCGAKLDPPKGRGRRPKWCSDKCRKQTLYSGTCIECGSRTNGIASGHDRKPERCLRCARNRHQARNERIIAAWNDGERAKSIGEREGMNESAVVAICTNARNAGQDVALHRTRNRSDWPEIEALFNAGLTYREIATAIGCSPAGVSQKVRNMRERGYDLPRRAGRPKVAQQ